MCTIRRLSTIISQNPKSRKRVFGAQISHTVYYSGRRRIDRSTVSRERHRLKIYVRPLIFSSNMKGIFGRMPRSDREGLNSKWARMRNLTSNRFDELSIQWKRAQSKCVKLTKRMFILIVALPTLPFVPMENNAFIPTRLLHYENHTWNYASLRHAVVFIRPSEDLWDWNK